MIADLDALVALCNRLCISIVRRNPKEIILSLGHGFRMSISNDSGEFVGAIGVGEAFTDHFRGEYLFRLADLHGVTVDLPMNMVELLTCLAKGEVVLVEVHRGSAPPRAGFLYCEAASRVALATDEYYVIWRAEIGEAVAT